MKTSHTLALLTVLASASIATAQAAPQDMAVPTAARADAAFVNPDWAHSAWYMGAGVGRARANIDDERLTRSLTATGATLTRFDADERDTGFKLFAGKQLNRYIAIEAGYFDLGTFSFDAATSGNGALRGEAGFRGVNLDLVGQLALTQRLSLLGRAGVQYAKTRTHFSGNRLNAVTDPNPASKNHGNAKLGLGLEYKLSEALAVRGEVERYRLNDAVNNRGDVDLASVSLVYKFGRPAKVAYVAPAPVAAAPAAPVAAPVVAAPEPVPSSEKVSIAAEALFDFDKSIVKPEGKAALDEFMAKLEGMNTEVMIAVGHTDSVGTDAYNDKLSMRRADAVKAYMVSKGLDPARLYTEGKGESQPVADNATAEGRAKNRRVTIEVVGTRTVR
ncbi:OmpA family protein [Massilia sp. H6]|uniref:OmpA family protein n=1 Tax=Massilia sp. H6 TaxID=2970464 RepID=UPI002167836F|nr:OmpA family protein [Massilia sp. H6]UVW28548.1 OmpA family protein [Massilia sp. H6]